MKYKFRERMKYKFRERMKYNQIKYHGRHQNQPYRRNSVPLKWVLMETLFREFYDMKILLHLKKKTQQNCWKLLKANKNKRNIKAPKRKKSIKSIKSIWKSP